MATATGVLLSPFRMASTAFSRCSRRVLATQQAGNKVVAVVSAMSGVTDSLIKLAKEVHPEPNEREMDVLLATGEQTTIALLAMALHGLGAKAVSLPGDRLDLRSVWVDP